jgi:DNA primase
VLYGLDLARRDISRSRQVVVVEGYTDVMACHLSGVTTAVATCGTAFGVDHIKIVRRVIGDVDNADTTGTGEVIFTFDPDEAGQKAASRAFAEEQRFAAQTYVAVAPDNLDPCDLRLNRGEDAVRALIKRRRPMFEFMIRRHLDTHDLETVEGRVAALREAAPVVAGIRDQAMSGQYIRQLAGWLGMEIGEVTRAVSAAKRSTSFAPARTSREAEPGDAAAQTPTAQPEFSLTDLPVDPPTRQERDAIMAILQYPTDVGRELVARVTRVRFVNPTLTVVRDAIASSIEALDSTDWVAAVTTEVPPPYASLVQQLAVAPIPSKQDRMAAYCAQVASDLVDRELLRTKADLLGALQRTDRASEPDRYRQLQEELVSVETERRGLRDE